MKDTFHSFGYKGKTIHTCFNRADNAQEVKVMMEDSIEHFKSVHAAKIAITRYHKRHQS